MTSWGKYVVLPYGLLLLINLLLIVLVLFRGRRWQWLCRLAVWANAGVLSLVLSAVVIMLCHLHTAPEARFALLATVLLLTAPLAVEVLTFATLYLWRTRRTSTPPN